MENEARCSQYLQSVRARWLIAASSQSGGLRVFGRVAAAASLIAGASTVHAGSPNKEYGAHDYQLLLIGMSDYDGKLGNGGVDNGKRIFVRLDGRTKIMLTEGDYDVIDSDGTDGEASFQLPNPDPDGDGVTTYRVLARALGKPSGYAEIKTCAEDATGQLWCSTYSDILMCDSGGKGNKPRWQNTSRSMLYLQIDIDLDGKEELVPLFDDSLEDYYWQYDNNGLRVVQLRFYSVPQDVCSEAGGTYDGSYCELP